MKNTNNKVLAIAVVLLLATNLVLAYFLIAGKTEAKKKPDPAEVMAKELGMTEEQVKLHKQYKDEHFKTIRPLNDSVRTAKSAYYALVKDSTASDSLVRAFRQRIYELQGRVDSITFAHFKKVRNLFTPEQQPKFDEFVQRMMQRGRRDSSVKK